LLEPLVSDGASEPPQPKNRGGLNIDEIRCCEFSVLTEQIPGLPTALPVVAEHGGIDDHLLERSSARSAAV